MTHHDDVVIKDAANIEGAGGTTTESMTFVEGLRVLVGAVGAQSHGCVPALRRISDRTLDERAEDAREASAAPEAERSTTKALTKEPRFQEMRAK